MAGRYDGSKIGKRWEKYDYRDCCRGEAVAQLLSNSRFSTSLKHGVPTAPGSFGDSSIALFRLSTPGR